MTGLFSKAPFRREAEVANVGAHLTIDSTARQVYARQIKATVSPSARGQGQRSGRDGRAPH